MAVHPVGARARPLDPVITVRKPAAVVAVVVAAVAVEIATAAATLVAAAAEATAVGVAAAAEAGPAHPEPEVMEAITLVVMAEAGPMWTGSIVKLLILFI